MKNSTYFKILLICTIFIYGLNILVYLYVFPEKWVTAQFIAMMERLLAGLPLYPDPANNSLGIPVSVYFPGTLLFLTGINFISFGNIEIGYKVFSFLLFSSIIILNLRFLKRAGVNYVFSILVLVLLIQFGFAQAWISTVAYLKGDTFIVVSSLILTSVFFNKNLFKIIKIPLTIVILIIAASFKQQAITIYAALFLFILMEKNYTKLTKTFYTLMIVTAGLVFLYIIFSIDNLFETTVLLPMKWPHNSLGTLWAYFLEATWRYSLLYIPFFGYIIYLRQIKAILPDFQKYYLMFIIFWIVMCIMSLTNAYANQMSIELALLSVLPFSILGYQTFFIFLKEKYKFNSKMLIGIVCLIIILFSIRDTKNNVVSYQERIIDEKKLIEVIKKQSNHDSKVLMGGDQYSLLKKAGIKNIYDLATLGIYFLSKKDMSPFLHHVENGYYDIVVGIGHPYSTFLPFSDKLQKSYKLVKSSEIPVRYNQKIWIRK